MWELLAIFLVGLSFFFLGVGAIRSNLQQLATRRFRRWLAEVTESRWRLALAGFLSGAVTQSSTAVSFLLAGLISSGSLSLRGALPVVGWSNLGVTVLVFLSAVRLDLAILYLLGLTGLVLVFGPGGKGKILMQALFGVGLLFYGLMLMKKAFGPLAELEWAGSVSLGGWGTLYVAYGLGAVLRTVVQSSAAIAVIAVALAGSGALGEGEAFGLMLGTGAGVALSVFFLSADLRGLGRQIAWFQGGVNGLASVVAVLVVSLGVVAGYPLAERFLGLFPGGIAERLAFGYLGLQGLCTVLALGLQGVAPGWLARWSPATVEEDVAAPRYLSQAAMEDPETALDLAEREQGRFLEMLPRVLDGLREETRYRSEVAGVKLASALERLGVEIGVYLGDLMDREGDRETRERLLRLVRRNGLIVALAENLRGFVEPLEEQMSLVREEKMLAQLVEGLTVLLMTAAEAVKGKDPTEVEALLRISADRGELMERMRKARMEAGEGRAEGRAAVFYATTLFERLVWLLHQFGRSLADAGGVAGGAAMRM